MDLAYSLSDSILALTGDWGLEIVIVGNPIRLTGPGTVTFDSSTPVATITDFQGTLVMGGQTWDVTMDSVEISLVDNPSLIPSGGTIALDGGFFRRLIVRFNPNSLSTGMVEVSFLGLVFFPVNINSL